MTQARKRHWALIAYPESMPENWEQLLTETGLECCISPLHDRDLKEDDSGELKKPHYHIIVKYRGPTSPSIVKELAGKINAPTWKPVESLRGAVRYQTHKDNPEKAQYQESDIKCLNGFELYGITDLTSSELRELSFRCQDLINQQQIFEYADLMDLLQSMALQDPEDGPLYDYADNHTLKLTAYISSKRNKAKEAREKAEKAFSKQKKAGASVSPLEQEKDSQKPGKSPLRELFGDQWADEEGVE